jgi:hypothetical protein
LVPVPSPFGISAQHFHVADLVVGIEVNVKVGDAGFLGTRVDLDEFLQR